MDVLDNFGSVFRDKSEVKSQRSVGSHGGSDSESKSTRFESWEKPEKSVVRTRKRFSLSEQFSLKKERKHEKRNFIFKQFFTEERSAGLFFFIIFGVLVFSPYLIFTLVDSISNQQSIKPHIYGYDDLYKGVYLDNPVYAETSSGVVVETDDYNVWTVDDIVENVGGRIRVTTDAGLESFRMFAFFKISGTTIINEGFISACVDVYMDGDAVSIDQTDTSSSITIATCLLSQPTGHESYLSRTTWTGWHIDDENRNVFFESNRIVSLNAVPVLLYSQIRGDSEENYVHIELIWSSINGDLNNVVPYVVDFELVMYSNTSFRIFTLYQTAELITLFIALFWLAVITITTNIFHIQDMFNSLNKKVIR